MEIERIKIKKRGRERDINRKEQKIGKNSNFLNALKREQKAKVYIISSKFEERGAKSKLRTENNSCEANI